MRFLVINGPNLDLLGTREPEVYGTTTLADLDRQVSEWAAGMGAEAESRQWNSEGEIIDAIHGFDGDGIVLNPGALTHTSHAIGDAIRGVAAPVVEVHISNIKRREPWRAVSVTAEACVRSIYGRGIGGYHDALRHLVNRASMPFQPIRYGPHDDNIGDLRRGGTHLAVIAHGGLWKQEFERDTTESLAIDLAKRGYSTWNIEYRRVGLGGGWPASGHDVLMALDFTPQLDLDVTEVTLVSHSVGSQLLMWAAPRSTTEPVAHVALGPLLNLATAVEFEDLGAAECAAMLRQGAPESVDPLGVPTLLVHGDADQIVPVERTVAYADRHGVEHHRTGCDHFSLLDPTSPEWAYATAWMGQRHEQVG